MNASPRCVYLANIISTDLSLELDEISPSNSEVISYLVAGAVCFAENRLERECRKEYEKHLVASIVVALKSKTLVELELVISNSNLEVQELLTVALTRYSSHVVRGLSGFRPQRT